MFMTGLAGVGDYLVLQSVFQQQESHENMAVQGRPTRRLVAIFGIWQPTQLAKRMDGVSQVVVDRPGHGTSRHCFAGRRLGLRPGGRYPRSGARNGRKCRLRLFVQHAWIVPSQCIADGAPLENSLAIDTTAHHRQRRRI